MGVLSRQSPCAPVTVHIACDSRCSFGDLCAPAVNELSKKAVSVAQPLYVAFSQNAGPLLRCCHPESEDALASEQRMCGITWASLRL